MKYNFGKTPKIAKSKGKGIFKSDGNAILLMFVGVLLAITLLTTVADTQHSATTKLSVSNTTQIIATNGTHNLEGKVVTGFSAFNATNGTAGVTGPVIGAGNYSIKTGIVNGNPQAQLVVAASPDVEGYAWNVSYTYEPLGYVEGTGGTLLTLVILFGSLGVLVFIIVILYSKSSFKNLIRR